MLQSSNVLLVGASVERARLLGVDNVATYAAALEHIKSRMPEVVVFGRQAGESLDAFCSELESCSALWILAANQLGPDQIVKWINSTNAVAMVDDLDDPALEVELQRALEISGENRQRDQLQAMFQEQSSQLARFTKDLEQRVLKRQKTLSKTSRKLENTNRRMEAFHKALLGIHRASTFLQIEQSLVEALSPMLDLESARIRFDHQSHTATLANTLRIELPLNQDRLRAEVLFIKKDQKAFESEETDFLFELSEALTLALSGLQRLDEAEVLKSQWQATFDSIPHPLTLVSAEGEITKVNLAFQQACNKSFRALMGKRWDESFFNTTLKLREAPLTIRQSRGSAHYEVSVQRLGEAYLVRLRNVTEEIRFERRLLEASKLAELGTIGSSIAHELNNPLGGMLSFLQLILMDLDSNDPQFADVKSMEDATLRCRDIVQNLLSFARKQDLSDMIEIDLRQVIERAVKIMVLQTKSKGIGVFVAQLDQAMIKASFNALTQAICNLLQNGIDAINVRRISEPSFQGQIQISTAKRNSGFELRIQDNGGGIAPSVQSQIFNPLFTTRDSADRTGMGLTTAFTIVSEHHGTLEILSELGQGTQAIVVLPSPQDG